MGLIRLKAVSWRTHLSVIYADEVQHKLSIAEKIVGCGQCHAGGNDVIEHNHSPLIDWAQQHEVRVKSATVDTLNGIAVKWNVEVLGYMQAHRTRKEKTIVMPSPRSGDDAPIIKRSNKASEEATHNLCKIVCDNFRLLYFSERHSAFGSTIEGCVIDIAEAM